MYTAGSSSYNKNLVGVTDIIKYKNENIITGFSKSDDKLGLIKYNSVACERIAFCYGNEVVFKLGHIQAILDPDKPPTIHWYKLTCTATDILSQTDLNLIREYQKSIYINLVSVKAHTGNKVYRLADVLAKKSKAV
ncbi:putative RNase H [Staphylococcus phage vB_SauH_DELF3]|nr:putative RNase H [Staphylococcus phage vB_SauH_DELF3]